MKRNGGRAAEAERRLADLGIQASVESGGSGGEVAIIRPSEGVVAPLLGELRDSAVEQCRAAGFLYVALELY